MQNHPWTLPLPRDLDPDWSIDLPRPGFSLQPFLGPPNVHLHNATLTAAAEGITPDAKHTVYDIGAQKCTIHPYIGFPGDELYMANVEVPERIVCHPFTRLADFVIYMTSLQVEWHNLRSQNHHLVPWTNLVMVAVRRTRPRLNKEGEYEPIYFPQLERH